MPGWIVGPVAATAALLAIGFTSLGVYASGGGLLIAAGIAFWVGAGVAGWVEPKRQGRNTAIVALYIVVLFAAWLTILQSQPPPPGTSFGGPNVERPR